MLKCDVRTYIYTGFSANLLPFGFGLDTSYDNQDDGSTMVGTLSTPYVLYGTSYTTVFVSYSHCIYQYGWLLYNSHI